MRIGVIVIRGHDLANRLCMSCFVQQQKQKLLYTSLLSLSALYYCAVCIFTDPSVVQKFIECSCTSPAYFCFHSASSSLIVGFKKLLWCPLSSKSWPALLLCVLCTALLLCLKALLWADYDLQTGRGRGGWGPAQPHSQLSKKQRCGDKILHCCPLTDQFRFLAFPYSALHCG